MKEISFNEFDLKIKDGKCVVSFSAPWCRDCVFAKPILLELSKKYTNINFYEINVDTDELIREKMSIRHIPTILFMKDGKEVLKRIVEPRSSIEIEEQLKQL